MSAREWKPGDVASRTSPGAATVLSFLVPRCSVDTHVRGPHWHHSDGAWDHPDGAVTYQRATYRPLVVIDPEDRASIVSLMNRFWDEGRSKRAADHGADEMQAALRSLVTPPKPEEPTGLGAVVEDAEGRRYIRTSDTDCQLPWSYANNFSDHEWGHIAAVKVLSEGVTP